MTMQIAEVDPFDDETFDAWHAAYRDAEREGLGEHATVWTLEELRTVLREPDRRGWRGGYVGRVGERVVCSGYLGTPLLDNLDSAFLRVDTIPTARRRGHGTRMLAHLERAARDHGRSRLDTEATWPDEFGPEGHGWAGREFALARGYTFGLGDVQRELTTPVADDLLADLAAEAAPHHTAYTLRSWAGPVPDDIVAGWLDLSATLMTEAPTGEMEREPESTDVGALREMEATLVKQERVRYHTVALDGDGQVAAYTDLVTAGLEPGKAYQWGTLVRRADRGHRLGLAVKVANLQQLQRERRDALRLVTWNAEINSHMIDVNARLGFRPVARLGEFQKRLG